MMRASLSRMQGLVYLGIDRGKSQHKHHTRLQNGEQAVASGLKLLGGGHRA